MSQDSNKKLSARARAQRRRIAEAAQTCFVRRGFHATSIAEIASQAQMSQGLIYRYFDSKAAIVMAIIDQQLDEAQTLLDRLGGLDDLLEAVLDAFDRWQRREGNALDVSLFLDVAAEAGRDPQIASAVQAADRKIRERLEQALRRIALAMHGRALEPVEARERALMVQCLYEGIAIRMVRNPALTRDDVEQAMRRAFSVLML